jgi:hypothetical protein
MPVFRKKTSGQKIANYRRQSGQSLIETLSGFILIIPLALFSYDLTFILISSQSNERLAENAARSAANHATSLSAKQAAQTAVDTFNQTSGGNTASLVSFDFDDDGQISLITQIEIKLPVSLASWSKVITSAHAVVPVVAYPAPI